MPQAVLCRNCKFWTPPSEGAKHGRCEKAEIEYVHVPGEFIWAGVEYHAIRMREAVRDAEFFAQDRKDIIRLLRTSPDFGCVAGEAVSEGEPK